MESFYNNLVEIDVRASFVKRRNLSRKSSHISLLRKLNSTRSITKKLSVVLSSYGACWANRMTIDEAMEMIEDAVRCTGVDSDILISRFVTPHQRFNPSDNRVPFF